MEETGEAMNTPQASDNVTPLADPMPSQDGAGLTVPMHPDGCAGSRAPMTGIKHGLVGVACIVGLNILAVLVVDFIFSDQRRPYERRMPRSYLSWIGDL